MTQYINGIEINLTPSELKLCEEVYNEFRPRANSVSEFRQLINALDPGQTDQEFQDRLDRVGYREGHLFTLEHLLSMMQIARNEQSAESMEEAETLEAFIQLGGEVDKSGIVNASKLRSTIFSFPLNIDVDKMLEEIDEDGSGEIEYGEFEQFYRELQEEQESMNDDMDGDESDLAATGRGNFGGTVAQFMMSENFKPSAAGGSGFGEEGQGNNFSTLGGASQRLSVTLKDVLLKMKEIMEKRKRQKREHVRHFNPPAWFLRIHSGKKYNLVKVDERSWNRQTAAKEASVERHRKIEEKKRKAIEGTATPVKKSENEGERDGTQVAASPFVSLIRKNREKDEGISSQIQQEQWELQERLKALQSEAHKLRVLHQERLHQLERLRQSRRATKKIITAQEVNALELQQRADASPRTRRHYPENTPLHIVNQYQPPGHKRYVPSSSERRGSVTPRSSRCSSARRQTASNNNHSVGRGPNPGTPRALVDAKATFFGDHNVLSAPFRAENRHVNQARPNTTLTPRKLAAKLQAVDTTPAGGGGKDEENFDAWLQK